MSEINIVGARLTPAQSRILEAAANCEKSDALIYPRVGESIAFARLAGKGILKFEHYEGRRAYYSLTLHGKGIAAALVAYLADLKNTCPKCAKNLEQHDLDSTSKRTCPTCGKRWRFKPVEAK